MNAIRTVAASPPLKRRRYFLKAVRWGGLLLLVLLLFCSREFWLTRAGEFLDASDPPQKVDYVLVLHGGETRPFVAAALVKAGLARQVLVPTPKIGELETDGILPRLETVTQKILQARGVAEDAILFLREITCESTSDEARSLALFLDGHPDATVAVVTDDFHTRRSRLIFQRALGNRKNEICFIAAPVDKFNKTNWWQCADGFITYTSEYIKLVRYCVGDQ